MFTFYITQDGSLERESNTLVFTGKDFKKHIPVKNVSDIIITGKVSMSSWAIDYLAKLGIIVHIIGLNGDYRSSLIPIGKNEIGSTTVKQAMAYASDMRLEIAYEFVEGIKHNIIRNLRYYNKDGSLDEKIEGIRRIEIKKENINGILGAEGNIWSSYYSAFGRMFKDHENFRRKFHPPPDDLNALISYGNTLLYSTALTNIVTSSLNPSISFLHEPSDRSFSLALDVADVFKPVIVERLLATLVNNRSLDHEDFEERNGGVYLTQSSRLKYVTAYRNKMETTVKYGNRYVSYDGMILQECFNLRDYIVKGRSYKSFRAWD